MDENQIIIDEINRINRQIDLLIILNAKKDNLSAELMKRTQGNKELEVEKDARKEPEGKD